MKSRSATAAALVAAMLGGCAGTPERPVAELARAETSIDQAAQAGAPQYAAADLNRAREKLQQANDAARKDGDRARHLALEATADAEVAAAKAQQAKAEEAAAELARSVETLRRESARGSTSETR